MVPKSSQGVPPFPNCVAPVPLGMFWERTWFAVGSILILFGRVGFHRQCFWLNFPSRYIPPISLERNLGVGSLD